MEGTSTGVVDIIIHVDIGGSEDGTEMDTHGKPTQTQEGDEVVSRGAEGGQ